VAVPVEQQQDRVPAELQQVAAQGQDGFQHPGEDRLDDVGQLLRAHPAAAGQALAERGEAGDVGEQQRRIELAGPHVRLLGQPARVRRRQVAPRAGGRRGCLGGSRASGHPPILAAPGGGAARVRAIS